MHSATRVGFSHGSKDSDHRIASEFAAVSVRIAHKRLNELQRRRLLRRTSTHKPMPILIGENREVLHRLHVSPTGQRFPRAWYVDFPSGAHSALLEALTITCQLLRVINCGRAPCADDGRNQPHRQDMCISHRHVGAVLAEACPLFRSQSRFPSEIGSTGPYLISTANVGQSEAGCPCSKNKPRESPLRAVQGGRPRSLIAHYRQDGDWSKPGKPKGACTGRGQINAAAFNVRPSVRDRDRNSMSGLLVGYPHRGTKGQRFVRCSHVVVVERDSAGSF